MTILNAFEAATTKQNTERLAKLTNETTPQWGKMNAAQMLAHLNVSYKFIDSDKTAKKANFLMRFMMKKVIKPIVVGDKPYKKNSRTAPEFIITTEREFESEKAKLIANMEMVQQKGAAHFNGLENPGFGELTTKEWSNLFQKHIQHHFDQFGL